MSITVEELFDRWRDRSDQAGGAVEVLAAAGLPDRREEGWRWSDLRAGVSVIGPRGDLPCDPFAEVDGIRIDDWGVRGRWMTPCWREDLAPLAGVVTALSDRSLRVVIETSPRSPLVLSGVDGNDRFDRVDVVIAEGVQARLVESRLASGGFYGATMAIHVGRRARLERIICRAGARRAAMLALEDIRLEAGADLTQLTVTAGAGYCRTDCAVTMAGDAASVRMDALYVLGDTCHADLSTCVRHRARRCQTRQIARGVVGSGGRGVFQGKFDVARAAQQTDAHMHHRAILLDASAWAFARPELEIYADDVACGHGNAIGALDADMIAYARQRGLAEPDARALVARGCVAEAFEGLSADDPLRPVLDDVADRWITHIS